MEMSSIYNKCMILRKVHSLYMYMILKDVIIYNQNKKFFLINLTNFISETNYWLTYI